MSDSDTLAVAYRVLGIEPLAGNSKLAALATIEIELAGMPITLQGVQLRCAPDGSLSVAAPMFRDGAGVWRSAVILPPELSSALAAEVLAAVAEPA